MVSVTVISVLEPLVDVSALALGGALTGQNVVGPSMAGSDEEVHSSFEVTFSALTIVVAVSRSDVDIDVSAMAGGWE